MVDFAVHFTIHAIKIGFQKYYILPGKCACQHERTPCYFHLDRINDSFAIHIRYSLLEFPHYASSREKIQGSLAVRKQLLKNGRF